MLHPDKGVPYRQVSDDLGCFGLMVQSLPGIKPVVLTIGFSPKDQRGLRHRPFVPIHNIFFVGPELLILYERIQKGYAFSDVAPVGERITPQVVFFSRKDLTQGSHRVQVKQ